MRDLRSNAKCPSMSFVAYQRCGTISAKQPLSEIYIRGKQFKEGESIVSCLPLSFAASLLTFFLVYFPKITNGLQQATAPSDAFPAT